MDTVGVTDYHYQQTGLASGLSSMSLNNDMATANELDFIDTNTKELPIQGSHYNIRKNESAPFRNRLIF